MGKAFTKVLIGAAIIGAAFLSGGASIAPSVEALDATTITVAGATITTAGAAAVAGGLVTTTLGGLALALGAATALSGVMQATARTPKVSLTQIDRLNASMVATAPRKMVFGHTVMASTRFEEI